MTLTDIDTTKKRKSRVNSSDVFIGKKLQEFRENFDITQTELGGAIGVTFQQIQKYEKGVNRIHAEVLYRISTTFGVDIEFFFPNLETVDNNYIELTEVFKNLDYKDKESITLTKSYLAIKDNNVRRKIVNLISSIIETQ